MISNHNHVLYGVQTREGILSLLAFHKSQYPKHSIFNFLLHYANKIMDMILSSVSKVPLKPNQSAVKSGRVYF